MVRSLNASIMIFPQLQHISNLRSATKLANTCCIDGNSIFLVLALHLQLGEAKPLGHMHGSSEELVNEIMKRGDLDLDLDLGC